MKYHHVIMINDEERRINRICRNGAIELTNGDTLLRNGKFQTRDNEGKFITMKVYKWRHKLYVVRHLRA